MRGQVRWASRAAPATVCVTLIRCCSGRLSRRVASATLRSAGRSPVMRNLSPHASASPARTVWPGSNPRWGRCAACAGQRRVRPVRVDRDLPARSRRRHTPQVPAARIHRNCPLRRSSVSGPERAGADRQRESGLRGTFRVPRGPTGGSRSRRGGSRSAADATDFNSVHVKNYVSRDQGLTKTVETLHLKAYGDIRSALASGSRDRRQGRSAPDPLIRDRP
jgi:hypothetical protein